MKSRQLRGLARQELNTFFLGILLLSCKSESAHTKDEQPNVTFDREYVTQLAPSTGVQRIRVRVDNQNQRVSWIESAALSRDAAEWSYFECSRAPSTLQAQDGTMPARFPKGTWGTAGMDTGRDLASKVWIFDRDHWSCLIFSPTGEPFLGLRAHDELLSREEWVDGKLTQLTFKHSDRDQ